MGRQRPGHNRSSYNAVAERQDGRGYGSAFRPKRRKNKAFTGPFPRLLSPQNSQGNCHAFENFCVSRHSTRSVGGGGLFGNQAGAKSSSAKGSPDLPTQPPLAGGGPTQTAQIPAFAVAGAGIKDLSHGP